MHQVCLLRRDVEEARPTQRAIRTLYRRHHFLRQPRSPLVADLHWKSVGYQKQTQPTQTNAGVMRNGLLFTSMQKFPVFQQYCMGEPKSITNRYLLNLMA